jgi:catechol 2,3-dioxygenase-like lactoylglutathione lyase family enzyme
MASTPITTVNVRYMVDDVDAAVGWYTKHLGFTVLSNAAPAFADVTLGSLRLLLSGPTSSAGRAMPDGERPGPGGWNRIHLIVEDISPRSCGCAPPASNSATTSLPGPADRRSC